ncbi:hypothetical protein PLICRDRAFT_107216 [Plicaturopsis crispa FD-325 SS-3]|nr:hypothetical protein PLICRDRAFT_107216 [Plicaturopsis crispa FD-325 SS-3]
MRHPIGWYRVRLLLDIGRTFIAPSVVLAILLRLANLDLRSWTIPTYLLFIVGCIAVRNILVNLAQARQAKQFGAKPIPKVVGKWPGNIDILMKIMRSFEEDYILDAYLALFEEYKCTTLNTRILWVDQIITMDHEHSKFVLSTGFEHFWRGFNQKERMENMLGGSIFNRDGEQWKMHRAMARPFFARERVSDFEIFERQTTRTLSIISSISSSPSSAAVTPIEAQDLYSRFTLDAASEFLFGRNMDTLSADLPSPSSAAVGPKGSLTHDKWGSFAYSFEAVQQVITKRGRLGYFWPIFEVLGDKTTPHVKVIREWLDPLVRSVLQDKRREEKSDVDASSDERSFLQHLADGTDDVALIRDQLLSMLLASRDTTATLLTYITYFMAIHPEVAERLRSEVLENIGQDAAPTYESIRRLKYMRAVINETLRLFPPVPLNVRESRPYPSTLPHSDSTYSKSSDHVSPPTLYMPPSTVTIYLPMLTQRNPALWGPDADKFDPERWLDPNKLAIFTKNPTMFLPFSAGPRICIGQNYALNEASYFLVRLLQRFSTFTLAADVQPPESLPPLRWRQAAKGRKREEKIWPGNAMTLYVKGGMWVRFGKAST